MIRSSPDIKSEKKKVLIALGILFAVLCILFFNMENVFAKNKSEYQYTDGKFYMNVYINGEPKSRYTVPCSLGEDRPGVTPDDEIQSFVNYTLNLTWGDDTIGYHPWGGDTSIDSVDFSLPWYTFENRQFIWHFYMRPKTYGYHLDKVTSPEGNVQASCKGYSNGDFKITSDTNGLGITTYATGYRYYNTFLVYLVPNHYTLKYDGNGATSGSVEDRACTFGEGFNVADGGFSKTGYTLTGWNTKADGTGTHYDKNQWTSNLVGDDGGTITLYAQWEPDSYSQTINYYTYNASGPYNGASFTWNQYGSPKRWNALYGSYFDAYSKRMGCGNIAGYHWWSINSNGWNVTGDGSTNSHFYPNIYRLTVDLNKGSGSTTPSGTNGSFNMLYGTYKDLGTPTRTGYKFAGWKIVTNNSTGSSLSGNKFTMGYNKSNPYANYTGADTVKIQAQWTPITYTIKFNGNGATSGSMSDIVLKYDQAITLPNAAFTRTGHEYKNWNTRSNGAGTAYANKATLKNLTSSDGSTITLYAQWTANPYIIEYKTGKIGSSTIELGANAPTSATYDVAFKVDNPTATGYTFNGWKITGMDNVTHYYDSSTTTKTTLEGIKATTFKNLTAVKNGTVTFDASTSSGFDSWTANTYTVIYDSNSPASNERPITGSTPSSIHTYDVEKSLTKNGYAIEGWKFLGWNTKADGTGTSYADEASVINLTAVANGKVTLYAQWEDVEPPKAGADDKDHTGETDHEINIPDYFINEEGELEYDWTNRPVDVFIEITDNDYIESYKISQFDNYEAASATDITFDSESMSDDHHTANLYFRVSEEGITRYKVEVTDRTGNKSTYIVRVKIDYIAPEGTTTVTYDGYNLSVDVKDIIEELYSPGGFNMASGVKKVWVEVVDATSAEKKLDGVDYDSSATIFELNRDGDNIRTGAHYNKTVALNDGLIYDSDYIKVNVKVIDIAGNERVLYNNTLSSFYLDAYTERALGAAEAWKRGDGGYTNFETGRYTDKVELYYPEEWIASDSTLALEQRTYDYTGIQEETKTEADAFIAPIYTADGEYFITVKAYKNGHEKEVTIPIKTQGSILEGLRGRIRVRN